MGNCQVTNVAVLVIQHPNGRMERMHWSVTAGEVMQKNPGHYVSLIIPPPPSSINGQRNSASDQSVVSFTHAKLLRPHESLLLGRAYRLVTTQEVMNVIREKRYGKMKKSRSVSIGRSQPDMEQQGSSNGAEEQENSNLDSNYQGMQRENHAQRQRSIFAAARSKSWRPSLNSISEAGL